MALERYHRPKNIDEALLLLAEPNTAVLAGGTRLVTDIGGIEAVVDMQRVGANTVTFTEDSVTIGAFARLQALVDNASLPALVRDMAHREGPNTFRNMGTVGGTIALADWESELYAALLVHEAVVTTRSTAGEQSTALAAFRLAPGMLITAVSLQRSGVSAVHRVARTPADAPIVAAIGRRDASGGVRLALCGVAERPLLVAPADIAKLAPPADFRGSSVYRREMAQVLSARVLAELRAT